MAKQLTQADFQLLLSSGRYDAENVEDLEIEIVTAEDGLGMKRALQLVEELRNPEKASKRPRRPKHWVVRLTDGTVIPTSTPQQLSQKDGSLLMAIRVMVRIHNRDHGTDYKGSLVRDGGDVASVAEEKVVDFS